MREIKFRAWDKLNSKWVYFIIGQNWSEITLIVYHRIILDGGVFYQYTGLKDNTKWSDLSDKEKQDWINKGESEKTWIGKDIYEGDVLLNYNKTLLTLPEDKRHYLVKYKEGRFGCTDGKEWLIDKPGFVFEKINPVGKNYMSLIFNQNQIEIIGNIYENPELING